MNDATAGTNIAPLESTTGWSVEEHAEGCRPLGPLVMDNPTIASRLGRITSRIATLTCGLEEFPYANEVECIDQYKMKVLIKNPEMFRRFKDHLTLARGESHSSSGIRRLLHEYFRLYLRIPELRDDIARAGDKLLRASEQRGDELRREVKRSSLMGLASFVTPSARCLTHIDLQSSQLNDGADSDDETAPSLATSTSDRSQDDVTDD